MRFSHSLSVGTVVVSGLLMLRCGSSAGSAELLDEPDGSASSSSGSSGSSGDGGGGPGPSDGGGAVDATPGGNGGTTDAGEPGGSTTAIACGSTACAAGSQVCCVQRLGGGNASYACVTGATCPPPDAGGGGQDPPTALGCTGAANCAAGTVCCVQQVGNLTSSSCKATCTGQDTAQLCDPKATTSGCPADAGAQSTCSSNDISDWGLPNTFATCGGRGN